MDWKECFDSSMVKEVKPDNEMIKALLSSADNKMKSVDMLKTDRVTANSKLALAYDALREALEALAIKHGYKIYNHECYTCFLKEVLKSSSEAEEFDSLRRTRNKVNYYGKELSIEESNILVKKIKDLKMAITRHL